MRTSSSAGFYLWDAVESLRGAFASRSGGRSSTWSAHENIRAAILSALAQEPKNGRQVMQTIAARSDGAWIPSASAVYPMLQQLTDEGLVSTQHDGERIVYELTVAGREAAAEAAASSESSGDSPQRRFDASAAVPKAGVRLAQAAAQVAQSGTPEQKERTAAVLDEARRKVYAILAED
ncbi:PadR family transcriptional regulator [Lysobacter korlensis]|uniref:PadR family transcriptional regulator n=1 Tax=Lysobacter korlensis TaxID=553636 RepID=A0ABV6RTX9_9GAMM